MTHLRKLTLEELSRRNYSEGTTRAYLRIIEDFARYFHRPPDQLGQAISVHNPLVFLADVLQNFFVFFREANGPPAR